MTVRFHLRDVSMAFDLNWLEKVMVQQVKSRPFRAWKAPLCYVVNNLDGPAAKKEETQPLWPRAARRNRCAVVFAALWCRLKSWPQKASRTVSDRQLIPCRSPNIYMVRTKNITWCSSKTKNRTKQASILFYFRWASSCPCETATPLRPRCQWLASSNVPLLTTLTATLVTVKGGFIWISWKMGTTNSNGLSSFSHIFFPLKLPFWGIHGHTPFLDKPSFLLWTCCLQIFLKSVRCQVYLALSCACAPWFNDLWMAHWSTCLSLFNSARPVAATLNATICNDMQRTKQHSNKENWQVSVELSRSDQPSASCHGWNSSVRVTRSWSGNCGNRRPSTDGLNTILSTQGALEPSKSFALQLTWKQ